MKLTKQNKIFKLSKMATVTLSHSTTPVLNSAKQPNSKGSLSPNSRSVLNSLPKWAIGEFDKIQKDIQMNNGKIWSIKMEEDESETYHIISRCETYIRHDLLSEHNHVYYYTEK
jgi:hypothetical protein